MIKGVRAREFSLAAAIFAGILTIADLPSAAAQTPAPAPQSTPGTSLDAARMAFEALPEADRKALQEGLIWTGDYNGTADGTFGRQTYDAIASHQQASKKPPNGILSPSERNDLQASMQRAKSLTGFMIIDDPKTGVRIGVPMRVLPKQDANPNGGSRWQSADGKVTLDTRTAPPDATLQSLYDRNVAVQTPGRVISYKLLRPDFFVIAGETPTGKFYTRYASGAPGLRGFSIGYDKALAPQLDRNVVAIANSFAPFPTPTVPATVSLNLPPRPQQPQSNSQGRKLIGTGLVVGPRQVVTAAPVDSCKDLRTLDLKPQQIKGKGPFLVELAEDLKVRPALIANSDMEEGSSLLVVAFSEEGSRYSLTATPGFGTRNSLTAPLQPGASGAPVLDDHGIIVGLVGSVSSDQRKIAGILPTGSYPVVPASEIAKAIPGIVKNDGIPPMQKRSAADIVGTIRQALISITCGP
jgi:peptidoglycan hydrolase-like protein with peptidoglycan-binding domain